MAGKGNKQATWGGRYRKGPSPLMVQFSESVSFDRELARYDIQGSTAHARMLAHVGLISADERDAIVAGLTSILERIEAGRFEWKIESEDVHMNIEQVLRDEVPAGAKLHTARSRNDQVATDMRLFLREACALVMTDLEALMLVLVDLAENNAHILLPGYTHLQRAQPVSAAHHLLAWVEMFARDRKRFAQVADEVNVCPLGSGAIAGSTLPIDREFVARELDFVDAEGRPRITQNSMDAVADRDGYIDFAHACALCGVHMSRVAEDVILWNSAEFSFVELPDEYTTGSSLMPQKKNPDSMELVRGKSARLQGNLHALYAMVKGLPLTYNRDLQEDKPPVFDSLRQTRACLQVLAGALGGACLNGVRCAEAVADPALLATDLADYLVKQGVPFRDAHHIVGAMVAMAEDKATPLDRLRDEDLKALHPALESGQWREVFDLSRAMAARDRPGMPGPAQVQTRITAWREELSRQG